MLERFQPLLAQGSVLVDEADEGTEPRLLVYLEHAIRDGRTVRSGEPRAISQRLQFILLKEDGSAVDGGPAPYLDYRPITAEERALVARRDCRRRGCRAMSKTARSATPSQPRAPSILTK